MFYLHAGKNTKHTSQPFTVSLAFEMTLGQKYDPGSSAAEASGHPEQPLLLSAPGHLNSRYPQMYKGTQSPHSTHSNSSHEMLATPIVLTFFS